ncbi:S1 family peptidase [Chloroflexi bacterium TSY]|nr:S1 family peptidase [Chloroflexi bacterium TSY]
MMFTHPAVVGVAVVGDNLLVCADGPLTVPPKVEMGDRTYQTEVVQTGRFVVAGQGGSPARAAPYRAWQRPLQAGYSLGTRRTVGTAGLIVTPTTGRVRCLLLTAAHLLMWRGRRYETIVTQPAGPDGGIPGRDTIGRVYQVSRLQSTKANSLDAALIVPKPHLEFDLTYPGLGPLRGHCRQLNEGWHLYKVGRSTGSLTGQILSTCWSGYVDYPTGRCRFTRQVLIHEPGTAVSLPGDSGAVWVTPSGYAAALNFASTDQSGQFSIATPINRVLDAFNVQVVVP